MEMGRNILRQSIIWFLDITRNIQIALVILENFFIGDKAGIARHIFSLRIGLYNTLDILLPQPVLVTIFLEAAAGINEENAGTLIGFFLINDDDAGRNPCPIE